MSTVTMPLGVTAVMLCELDFDEQVELCASLGVTHYSIRPRIIGENQRDQPFSNWGNHKFDLTPERLVKEGDAIRRKLEAAGLVPFGTVPGASTNHSDDEIKLHLDGAAAAGAGRLRVNPEGYPKQVFDFPEYLKRVIDRYAQLIKLAEPYKLKYVIETHAWSAAADPGIARQLCEPFDPSQIGVMFDLPNFAREGNLQPVFGISILKDYIDQCHVGGSRRVSAGYDSLGNRTVKDQFCPISECDLNIPSYLRTLAEAGIGVPLVIEDYTENKSSRDRLTDAATELHRIVNAVTA